MNDGVRSPRYGETLQRYNETVSFVSQFIYFATFHYRYTEYDMMMTSMTIRRRTLGATSNPAREHATRARRKTSPRQSVRWI